MFAYALDPLIFYFALKKEGMAIMNLVWNLLSNLIVTLIGVVFFKEIFTINKIIGVILDQRTLKTGTCDPLCGSLL